MKPPPFKLEIGSVSFSCREGKVVTEINAPDAATGVIQADDMMASSPVDWSSPARVLIGDDVVTSGQVIEAVADEDGNVRWDVRSALMLSENRMPPMVIQNLAPQEVVYAAAREAGFDRDHMQIHGLDGFESEALWVLAPIRGLEVDKSTRVGVVEFIEGPTGAEMLRRFDPPLDPSLIRSFASARAFARVAVVASLIYDAEQKGISLIDTAAAWLSARVRYAWSELPAGHLQPYSRSNTRVEIARRDGVCVVAVDGARRWWRGTELGPSTDTVRLAGDSAWRLPPMPTVVPEADRDALLAIQRASTERDPIQRVAALWEAMEFYVGKRGTRKLFDDRETSSIVDRAISGLPDSKATRLQRLLEDLLNNASLMTRLRRVLDEDSVPLTDDDVALLRRLRRQRNRVVHGGRAVPDHRDLDRAIAIISRAIVIRWQGAR
jgi:hypothetical protein